MAVIMTKVKSALNLLPQPNDFSCQSASIAMVTDRQDTVMQVRKELEAIGTPGDPGVMAKILKRECGSRYEFYDDASLNEMKDWLKRGDALIVHTYLSKSGHVIVLNGVDIDPSNLSYKLHVLDPYAEFNAKSWSYNSANGYSGFYSSFLVYATAVAGQSHWDAERIYRRGELNSAMKNCWCHRVKGV